MCVWRGTQYQNIVSEFMKQYHYNLKLLTSIDFNMNLIVQNF